MKKLMYVGIVFATLIGACAQGTVNFSSLSTALSSPPDRLIRFGPAPPGLVIPASQAQGLPANTNAIPTLVAQLYYGSSTAASFSLIAVSTTPGTLRSSTSASAGTWFGNGTRTLAGFSPGDTVNLQVRVWDISKGTDYKQATDPANWAAYFSTPAGFNWFGSSAIFQYTIPTNPTPAPSEFNMNNFIGFSLIDCSLCPEPSTFALTGFGVAVLMFVRRRK